MAQEPQTDEFSKKRVKQQQGVVERMWSLQNKGNGSPLPPLVTQDHQGLLALCFRWASCCPAERPHLRLVFLYLMFVFQQKQPDPLGARKLK